MSNTFAIGIPTINRGLDLMLPSIMLYAQRDFPNTDIYIIDNGKQGLKEKVAPFKRVHLIEEETNLGVSASWNKLCKEFIFKNNKYALILNDDIYLGGNESVVNEVIKKNKSGFMKAHATWAAFIISKPVFDKVGEFDENLYPAYFEDNDYLYRMKLANVVVDKSMKLLPLVMRHSSSINKDPKLNKDFIKNKNYFVDKWGGEPNREKFKKPFNK
jgi:GT2 family glycosyltransferase